MYLFESKYSHSFYECTCILIIKHAFFENKLIENKLIKKEIIN